MVNRGTLPFDIQKWLAGYPALEQILYAMKQVVWVVNPATGQVVYASPAFETVWQCSRVNLYADPFLLIQSVHPEDRVKVLAASPDDHRKSTDQTYRIQRPDGSLRWISAHTFLIDAQPAYLICIAEDITDQHQVDETLRKALDLSREQFTLSRRMSLARRPEVVLKTLMTASALRSAQHASVLFFESPAADPARGLELVTSWAPASGVLGEGLNEAGLFEDPSFFDLFHPSRPVIITEIFKDQRLAPSVRDLLAEGHIETVTIFPLVALSNWLGCLLIFFPQETSFRDVELRHIKVLVDQATITLYNLHLLEIEAESRHEAQRANEIKTRFLAMISHELRTPLTSIKGFTTTLLADDVVWEPDEQRDFFLTIQQEANRLQELIDHLLDLSRLQAGMLPITQQAHTISEIFGDVLPQIKPMARQHSLLLRLPVALPPVWVDARRIAQVLVNLVHNAVLYTPIGTEILLTANLRRDYVQVSVIDKGPGIPPAERRRVFQAFRRGIHAEDGSEKGAGLGLAICKGLVEAHGGRIWVRKQDGPGTTISFTLPLAPAGPTKEV